MSLNPGLGLRFKPQTKSPKPVEEVWLLPWSEAVGLTRRKGFVRAANPML